MHSTEEKLDFIKSLDINPLISEIKRILNINHLFFHRDIKYTRKDEPYLALKSENIANACGIMSHLYDEVTIEEFSSQVIEEKDSDELGYYLPMHWQWRYKDGGMNGAPLINARYRNGLWEFGK